MRSEGFGGCRACVDSSVCQGRRRCSSRFREHDSGVRQARSGNIGNRSIESYLSEFSEQQGREESTGEEIAKELMTFIRAPYDDTFGTLVEPPALGFYLAGYSPKEHTSTEWEFTLTKSGGPPTKPRPDNQFGASWRGAFGMAGLVIGYGSVRRAQHQTAIEPQTPFFQSTNPRFSFAWANLGTRSLPVRRGWSS